MKKVIVTLLRRGSGELPYEQVLAIQDCFPGFQVHFQRTDPSDYRQHDEQCTELGTKLVLLPLEKPLPSLAMEHGIPHVTFAPDGKLMRLSALHAEFEPFVPDAEAQ